jgi:hypothetical protein
MELYQDHLSLGSPEEAREKPSIPATATAAISKQADFR